MHPALQLLLSVPPPPPSPRMMVSSSRPNEQVLWDETTDDAFGLYEWKVDKYKLRERMSKRQVEDKKKSPSSGDWFIAPVLDYHDQTTGHAPPIFPSSLSSCEKCKLPFYQMQVCEGCDKRFCSRHITRAGSTCHFNDQGVKVKTVTRKPFLCVGCNAQAPPQPDPAVVAPPGSPQDLAGARPQIRYTQDWAKEKRRSEEIEEEGEEEEEEVPPKKKQRKSRKNKNSVVTEEHARKFVEEFCERILGEHEEVDRMCDMFVTWGKRKGLWARGPVRRRILEVLTKAISPLNPSAALSEVRAGHRHFLDVRLVPKKCQTCGALGSGFVMNDLPLCERCGADVPYGEASGTETESE